VDRPPERHQRCFLDRLGERRMCGDRVGQRLDGGLGADADHAAVDQLGRLRSDDHHAQQLAVAGLVDRLHPARPLAVHHRAGRGRERHPADGDLVVRLGGGCLGQADGGHLGIGVDAPGHRRVVDLGVVAERVLGGDLALAEGRVGELPAAGAVADRVDVRDVRAHPGVRADACAGIEVDAGGLQPHALGLRAAAGGDQHQVGLDRALGAVCRLERDGGLLLAVLNGGRPSAQVHRDAALLERPLELLRRVRVLHRDQPVEHLDDRHLAAPVGQDRGELDADHAAAEDGDSARHLLDGQQAGRVDAQRPVDAVDWRS
jgi:hypothetical protein